MTDLFNVGVDELRVLERQGVIEECMPDPDYWRWQVLKPDQLPDWLIENFQTYGEIRWTW